MAMPQTMSRTLSTPLLSKSEVFAGLDYIPHSDQQKLHDSKARFRVVVAGRRWGKTMAAAKEGCFELFTPGTNGAIVAPTHPHTKLVFNQIEDDMLGIARCSPHIDMHHKSAPFHLGFDWGSWVKGFSAENADSARGYAFDWLIFDECALSTLAVWERVLRATLSDRGGWALFITTPQGYNWVYDLFERGKDPDHPEWFSLQSATWDNPFHNSEDLNEARNTLDDSVFRQEYGAEFTVKSGQVYPDFRHDVHVIPHNEMVIPKEWRRYRGIDWGFYPDPFVTLWFAVDGEDRIYIYDEYYKHRRSLKRHANFLVKQIRKRQKDAKDIRKYGQYRNVSRNNYIPPFDDATTQYEWTVADPHASGRANMVTMGEHGLPCWGVTSRVDDGLDKVRQRLAVRDDGTPGLYVSSRCVETIKEFNLYAYPESDSHNVGENPKDYMNHCMDTIRYLVMAFEHGKSFQVRPRLG